MVGLSDRKAGTSIRHLERAGTFRRTLRHQEGTPERGRFFGKAMQKLIWCTFQPLSRLHPLSPWEVSPRVHFVNFQDRSEMVMGQGSHKGADLPFVQRRPFCWAFLCQTGPMSRAVFQLLNPHAEVDLLEGRQRSFEVYRRSGSHGSPTLGQIYSKNFKDV